MSQGTWNSDQGRFRGFYRDRDSGWIAGVCAGLADRFNLRLGMVRIGAIISLLMFFWTTLGLYLAATLLFREKPLIYSGRQDSEFEFWRRHHSDYWSRP